MAAPNPVIPISRPRTVRARQEARMEQALAIKAPKALSSEVDRSLKLKKKIDRTAAVLDRCEARAKSYDAAIKLLQKRKQLALGRVERIEDQVLTLMQAAKVEKLTGNERVFSRRENAFSLVVEDASQIPAQFLRTIPATSEPDKLAIKSALLRGSAEQASEAEMAAAESIGGCRLSQSISLIRSKP